MNVIRLKALCRTEDEIQWLRSYFGDMVRHVSRVYESKSGFYRVHIDVEPPIRNSGNADVARESEFLRKGESQ